MTTSLHIATDPSSYAGGSRTLVAVALESLLLRECTLDRHAAVTATDTVTAVLLASAHVTTATPVRLCRISNNL